ncbi:hypothetical protein MRX96_016739 [Rhipicephalus microplus]
MISSSQKNEVICRGYIKSFRDYGNIIYDGKRKECKFRQGEVTFLGYRIDANGLRLTDENIKAVCAAPEPTSYRPYFNRRMELTVSDNLVYWGHRIVVPVAARRRSLSLLHETNPGIVAMKSITKTLFRYPGLDSDIERLVNSCSICAQASTKPPAQVPASWPLTGESWSRLQADFAEPLDGHMVLVIVDLETKYVEEVPMKLLSLKLWSELCVQYLLSWGLHKRSCQTIDHTEKALCTLNEGLKKNPGCDFITSLDQFLCRYCRTSGGDGKSPAERLLVYQIRMKLDHIKPKEKHAIGSPTASARKFNAGDPVWMHSFERSRRLIPRVVQDHQGSRTVAMDCSQGRRLRHLDELRHRIESVENDSGQKQATAETVQDSTPPPPQKKTVTESAPTPPLLQRSSRSRKQPEPYEL